MGNVRTEANGDSHFVLIFIQDSLRSGENLFVGKLFLFQYMNNGLSSTLLVLKEALLWAYKQMLHVNQEIGKPNRQS